MESTESSGWAQGKHYINLLSSSLCARFCMTKCFPIMHTKPTLVPVPNILSEALLAARLSPAPRLPWSRSPALQRGCVQPDPLPSAHEKPVSPSDERQELFPATLDAPVGTPAAAALLPAPQGAAGQRNPDGFLRAAHQKNGKALLCYPGDDQAEKFFVT